MNTLCEQQILVTTSTHAPATMNVSLEIVEKLTGSLTQWYMALQHHHNATSITFHSKTVILSQVYYARLQFPTITSTVQGLIAKLIQKLFNYLLILLQWPCQPAATQIVKMSVAKGFAMWFMVAFTHRITLNIQHLFVNLTSQYNMMKNNTSSQHELPFVLIPWLQHMQTFFSTHHAF